MTSRDIVEIASFFARTRFLGALSFHDLLMLAALTSTYRCPAGTLIFNKGDEGEAVYVVREGSVRIFLPRDEGRETTLTVIYAGDLFGELSLLDGMPRSASAKAMQDLEALTLGRQDFLGFLRKQPDAAIRMLAVLAGRLRRTDDLVADAVFLDGGAVFVRHLTELLGSGGQSAPSGMQLPLGSASADLSQALEITPEGVSQHLKRLSERGVITLNEETITVLDLQALADLGR